MNVVTKELKTVLAEKQVRFFFCEKILISIYKKPWSNPIIFTFILGLEDLLVILIEFDINIYFICVQWINK
jgi:putative effector of murein hydrolase